MQAIQARPVPVLETERLRLRPLSRTDAQAMLNIHGDEETVRYWGHDQISTLHEAEELINKNLDWLQEGRCIFWAVDDKAGMRMVGTCTLFHIDEQNRRAEVGYILNRSNWGQGMGSELLHRLISHAFEDMDLHRLEADTDPRNQASLALLTKFGFQREGELRQRWMVHGSWHDSTLLGLLRDEYQPPA